MNNKFYAGLCVLLLIPFWFYTNSKNLPTTTLLIQAYPNAQTLTSIIETVTPIINTIIKEELGLDKNYNFQFFLPKERQRLTLYYMYDFYENSQSLIFSSLENMKITTPHHISISSQINFFGAQQDELVVMINDPNEELSLLNQAMKKMAHRINNKYKRIHRRNLYNIAKSEQYSFLPHIGFGRIRLHSMKQHIQDTSQVDTILERIRQRIKKAVLEVINKILTPENQQFSFDKIGVLNLEKRIYIFEFLINKDYE